MESLIGIFGIFLGAFLSELFRRNNRVESFNNQIFNRRLEDYIDLMDLINQAYSEASEILENYNNHDDKEELLNKVSELIYPIVSFSDGNSFFISEELSLQCCTLFMGIEDINPEEVSNFKNSLTKEYKATIEMIKNEAGVNKMNYNMKKILGFHHKSAIITYYKKLKKN